MGDRDLESMKRTTLAVLLSALLLSACGGTPARASHPSPSPTQDGAVAPPGTLACRLPVGGFIPPSPKGTPDHSIGSDGMPNQRGTGGFLDLPSGEFTPVAGSDKTYLAAAGLWLPVRPQAISPDQQSYAVAREMQSSPGAAPTGRLYLVDIKSKVERLLFAAPNGNAIYVLAFTTAGVYVETLSSTGPTEFADLELIDPATGAHHAVSGAHPKIDALELAWTNVNGDTAWGMLVTKAQPPGQKLVKLNLIDGSFADWYDAPSGFLLAGFDAAGHPILDAAMGLADTTLVLVNGPNQTAVIPVKGGGFAPGHGDSVTDQHGTWFGGSDGAIWLYRPGDGLEKVATVPPQAGGSGQPYDPHSARSVAGPCV